MTHDKVEASARTLASKVSATNAETKTNSNVAGLLNETSTALTDRELPAPR
jgi:hypothetical protein